MRRIKIIGVGTSKLKTLIYIMKEHIDNVDFHLVDTIINEVPYGITNHLIGHNLTAGLGSGGEINIGKQAALGSQEHLQSIIDKEDLLIFLAGLGGGTGTGALPVMLKLAREKNILAHSIVTMPFTFEGSYRQKLAQSALDDIRYYCSDVIIIKQEQLSRLLPVSSFSDINRFFDVYNKIIFWRIMNLITA